MLEICLIGRFEVRRDGEFIEIPHRSAQSLLAYLALNSQNRFRREKVAGLLWHASDEKKARRQLRQALWRLRTLIGGEYFLADRVSIGLNPDAKILVDIDSLKYVNVWAEPSTDLVKSISNYCGEFLPGIYEQWVDLERQRLETVFERNMLILLGHLEDNNRWLDILQCGEAWISRGEVPEPAYRSLMIAHHRLGDISTVSKVYQRCVKALGEDLGVSPSVETRTLYEQLLTDESPEELPPIEYDHALPQALTTFIGRADEITELGKRLANPSCRLLTVIGPGGIGKTRLALQVAHTSIDDYRDGVFFIPLESLDSPELILSKIANILGFHFSEGIEPKQQIENYLREKEMLLVVDNLEQVISGAIILVNILEASQNVKILATSRERLNLTAEWVFEIHGMTYPEDDSLDEVETYGAVSLFLDRAKRISSDFAPTRNDLRFITQICQLVEGAPLAIELSAVWVRGLSCEEIYREIEENIDFLDESPRDGPERQSSLKASFNHSWKLLSDQETTTLRKLSVFRGGCQIEAAKSISSAKLSILIGLVDKSLLRISNSSRYSLHPLIRQFSKEELLKDQDEWKSTKEFHSRYYVDFAAEQSANIRAAGQDNALNRINEEIENIRAATRWAIDTRAFEKFEGLLESLRMFLDIRGWYAEGIRICAQVVSSLESAASLENKSGSENVALLAQALAGQSWFSHRLYSLKDDDSILKKAHSIAREFGLKEIQGDCLDTMAVIALRDGNYQYAKDLFLKCLEIWRELENNWWQGTDLICLSHVARSQGCFQEGAQFSGDALIKFRDLRNPWGIASALCARGACARELNNLTNAMNFYLESLIISKNIGWRSGVARASLGLSHVKFLEGEFDEAMKHCLQSYHIFSELGKKVEIPAVLTIMASIHRSLGDFESYKKHSWEAIDSALEIESSPEILRAFVGASPILIKAGEIETVVNLLTFTIQHPAIKYRDRTNAEELLSDLRKTLPQNDYGVEKVDLVNVDINFFSNLIQQNRSVPE
ncbi:MAG: AAA family ATPase [Candidatus Aminicenantes bacterium]|nr:AAA family ATPase [Candidatus Aminicenantes bacterium]